jgi:hypothetical protein
MLEYAFMAWCLIKHRNNFNFTFYCARRFFNDTELTAKVAYLRNEVYVMVLEGGVCYVSKYISVVRWGQKTESWFPSQDSKPIPSRFKVHALQAT